MKTLTVKEKSLQEFTDQYIIVTHGAGLHGSKERIDFYEYIGQKEFFVRKEAVTFITGEQSTFNISFEISYSINVYRLMSIITFVYNVTKYDDISFKLTLSETSIELVKP